MAGTTKGRKTNKGTARSGSRSTSRSSEKNTKSRGKKKNSSDDMMKLLLVLVVAGIAIAVIVLNQKDGENVGQTGNQGTPAPTVPGGPTGSPAPTKPEATPEPTLWPTPTPEVTREPEATPEPTPEPTEQIPTPTPVAITPEDARASIEQIVNTSRYKIELLNDHLGIENREYYQFCVSENGRAIEPFLVVDKSSGSVWCYDASGKLSECRKFPLDDVGNADGQEASDGTISAKKAYEVLCTYPKEKLGLSKEVKEYTPEYDDTLTLVKGVNCYRITLMEFSGGKDRNRGEFYISTDGKQCFCIDNDLGEFVPIP